MKIVPVLMSVALLSGCATSLSPLSNSSAPAPVTSSQAGALPPMGGVEEIDTVSVRRVITGTCGMESVERFVGEPRLTMSRHLLPANYRVLGLQAVATTDHQPERLTIRINEDDVIESMSCG